MLGTGLIHVYYGDGKGKTTAAVGQAIRAAGAGLNVLFFQFMKDNSSSERKVLEQYFSQVADCDVVFARIITLLLEKVEK